MKNILFFGELPPYSVNGVSTSNKINIDLLKTNFFVSTVIEVPITNQHSKVTFLKFLDYFKKVVEFFKLLLKYKYDFYYMVYSNSFFGGLKTFVFTFIVKLFNPRCKVVLHVHRGDLFSNIVHSTKNRLIFSLVEKLSAKIILLSQYERNKLASILNLDKLFVLKNCINREVNYQQKRNLKVKFIYLSNYILDKGILDLLHVFSLIDLDIELECFGEFVDENLKNQLNSFNKNNIKINGPIFGELKFEKLLEADCLILPSRNEGMPLVLLESMATGTPFICSNVGFIEENIFSDYPLIYNLSDKGGLLSRISYFLNLTNKEKYLISSKLISYYNLNFSTKSHKVELLKIFC